MAKTDTVQYYELKIPVYISEKLQREKGLFDLTQTDMIAHLKRSIDIHNDASTPIVARKRKKPQKKEIKDISYYDYNFGGTPTLYVQLNAANTNLYDTYIERGEIIELSKTDKVGSENNWLLFYPLIKGVNPTNYEYLWLIFIYVDPHRIFDDITQSAKLFVKHILGLKLKNVKTQDVINELKELGNTPEMRIKYTCVVGDNNDVDVKYQEYHIKGVFKKAKEDVFANMPFEYSEEMINETDYQSDFQRKEIYVIIGKKEYKIIKREQLDEAKKKLEDIVEETFNMSCTITESELDPSTLFDIEFMADKMRPVIENYLTSYV